MYGRMAWHLPIHKTGSGDPSTWSCVLANFLEIPQPRRIANNILEDIQTSN